MPLYDFHCDGCDHVFEDLVRTEKQVICPDCSTVIPVEKHLPGIPKYHTLKMCFRSNEAYSKGNKVTFLPGKAGERNMIRGNKGEEARKKTEFDSIYGAGS